jgi:hypothetical protein
MGGSKRLHYNDLFDIAKLKFQRGVEGIHRKLVDKSSYAVLMLPGVVKHDQLCYKKTFSKNSHSLKMSRDLGK